MEFLDNKQGLNIKSECSSLAGATIVKIAFQFNKDNVNYCPQVLDFIRSNFKLAEDSQRTTDYDFWLWYNGENDKYYFDITVNRQNTIKHNLEIIKKLQREIQEKFKEANFKAVNLWGVEYDLPAVDDYILGNSDTILLNNMDIVKPLIAKRYNIGFFVKPETIKKLDRLKDEYLQSLIGKKVAFYGAVGKILRTGTGEYVFRKRRARNNIPICHVDLIKIEEV